LALTQGPLILGIPGSTALSTMARAAAAIVAAADLPSLIAAVGPELAPLSADAYLLFMFREFGTWIEPVGSWERGGTPAPLPPVTRWPRAEHPSLDRIKPNEPLLIDDAAHDARLDEPTRRLLEGWGLGALAGFALAPQGEMLGVFIAACCAPRVFPPEERAALEFVAHLMSVAVANIEGRGALARKVQQVRALYRAGETLSRFSDEKALLDETARMLAAEAGHVTCWIGLIDPSGRVLRPAAAAGPGTRLVPSDEYPLDDPTIMAVATLQGGRAIFIGDIQARADAEGWGHVARDAGMRGMVQVPLLASGQALGVLGVGSSAPRLPEDELSLIAAFGNQLATALLRVRMDRERGEQVAKLQQAYEQQAKLLDVVRELSTPVIPVHDRVLVLPLVGTIDSIRSAQIMDALLSAVQRERASVVILDVTGVPVVDSRVANHLLQAARAASLLGARCVLVGISPVVAQTIVALGIDLAGVVTRGNLQAGIAHALELLELEIRPVRTRRARE
jgi:anti-anti-sigma factor